MQSKKKNKNGCSFRPFGVQCFDEKPGCCAKCGWNPEVEARRIRRLSEKSGNEDDGRRILVSRD